MGNTVTGIARIHRPIAVLSLFSALSCLLMLWPAMTFASRSAAIDVLSLKMDKLDAEVLFRKDRYDTSSFPITIIEGDKRLTGRIAVKGSFTRRFPKKSLLIKLDKGLSWKGQRRIALNSMASDPSLMREWLAWDLIRHLHMAAPEARYTRLLINKTRSGLFLNIEWIDPGLLSRFGLGKDGEFYHPVDATFCGDLSLANTVGNPGRCWDKLSPRDPSFDSLIALAREIDDTPATDFHQFIQRRFDVDALLNWMAVNTITSNGDSYNKNYFLYLSNKTGKWVVIPWDYDLSFGRNWDPVLPYPENILNNNFQYYYPESLGMPTAFKKKILANTHLKQQLLRRIAALLGKKSYQGIQPWFTPAIMTRRINMLSKILIDDIAWDPFLIGRLDNFTRHTDALKYYSRARYHYLDTVVINKPSWKADKALRRFNRNTTADFVDGWGRLLASIAVARPGPWIINTSVIKQKAPSTTPAGISKDQCLQRTLFLHNSSKQAVPIKSLRWEYTYEFSNHTDLGKAITDERELTIWYKPTSSRRWQALSTKVNVVAKTLSTDTPIRIVSGQFIACQHGNP